MIRVLFMDDEPRVCQLLRHILRWEELGFQIVGEANDGVDGLEKAKQLAPDLVIMDIRMPGMDGLTLIREIKKFCAQTQFLIISGYRDFEYAQTALREGVQGYLLKPLDRGELEGALCAVREEIVRQQELLRFRTMFDDSRQRLADHFFRELLRQPLKEALTEAQISARFGYAFRPGAYRVVLYKPDTGTGAPLPEPRIAQMRRELAQWFSAPDSVSVFLAERAHVVQIFNYAPQFGALAQIEAARAALAEHLRREGIALTAGAGSEQTQLKGLSESFRAAERALHSRILLGTGRVLCADSLPAQPGEVRFLTVEEQKRLKTAVEICDTEGARQQIAEAMQRALHTGYAEGDGLYRLSSEMLEIVLEVMSTLDPAFDPRAQRQALEDCCDRKQLEALFERLLTQVQETAGGARCSYLIEKAREYIAQHYMDAIQAKDVAAVIKITPKYFSELFRKETGTKFTDYLCQYRMDIAKDLLKNSCERVNEIGCMVGYQDPKHFSKQFRKTVGVSPAQFRRLATGR